MRGVDATRYVLRKRGLPDEVGFAMILEAKNSHPRDSNITFFKSSHRYVVTRDKREHVVLVSVTSFCKEYFTQFDPRRVVNENFEKWKHRPNSKYYAMIRASLQSGSSEEATKQAIIDMWTGIGNEASDAGTDMHERAEHVCNGIEADANDYEMKLLKEWTQVFQPEMKWQPYRTEWMLWWDEPRLNGSILVAGTLDLLLKSETTGEFALVDFKRTNPNPKYSGGPTNLLGPCANPRYHPGANSSLEPCTSVHFCTFLHISYRTRNKCGRCARPHKSEYANFHWLQTAPVPAPVPATDTFTHTQHTYNTPLL